MASVTSFLPSLNWAISSNVPSWMFSLYKLLLPKSNPTVYIVSVE